VSKLGDSIVDKFTIDYLRNQVLKNAYGNNDTPIARLDPRTLLVWYLFFGLVPWFLHNVVLLLLLFIFVAVTTKLARIAPLVLFLFCLGVFSQTGYLLIITMFFGGNIDTVVSLLILTLKVSVVSLASVTVFSGLDPDRLSIGLLYFGCPDQLSFSISFAYRILPVLMEEFQNILLSYRLRGKAPKGHGLIGKLKKLVHQVKIIILSFYPLILNTAKRSRTTVEALELKGYRYSMTNPTVRRMKLSALQFTRRDAYFAAISAVYVASCMAASTYINF
jgi:energy-coupling factor transport system permease protein